MNAIILAAGLGSRFGEMTATTSKTLLQVGSLPGMEHTLRFLQGIGVDDITIVIGYQAERFTYLEEKYGVRLVLNEKFREYNNMYSFSLALPYFGDTLVIDGDVVVLQDVFVPSEYSQYYLIQREESGAEWVPEVAEDGFVTRMTVTDAHVPSLLGISYWTKSDAERIRAEFSKYMTQEVLEDSKRYWDDIPTTLYGELRVRTTLVAPGAAREMDTCEQYESVCRLACGDK